MPQRVETYETDGVDFGWVMQVTFVATIVVGAPIVAVASLFFELSSWGAWAEFAIRVGALVWFVTAVAVYLVARRRVDAADTESDATELPND